MNEPKTKRYGAADLALYWIAFGVALYFTVRLIDKMDSVEPALLAFFWFCLGVSGYRYYLDSK